MVKALVVAGSLWVGAAWGQSSALPAFEVATIKLHPAGVRGHVGFVSEPGGRVDMGFLPVKRLMAYAFGVQSYQVTGGPGWAETDGYDVLAVPPEGSG